MSAAENLKIHAISVFSGKGSRSSQEDFVLVDREKRIFTVADGFGGPIAGSAAAGTACEAVRGFLFKEAGDLDATLPFVLRSYFSLAGNVLFNALIHANRKVNALNKAKDVHEKGGASVLAGFMDGNLLALANVGGCTAWLARGDRATELVMPRIYGRLRDPFVQDVRDEMSAPLMAMGMAEDLEPEIFEYRVQEGDWLLLHTDGLRAGVRDQLFSLKNSGLTPTQVVEQMNQFLQAEKHIDNTSVVLVIF